CARFHGYW
nr:immunoglobulin heavy chain junction region [Macaca mulatta]